MTTSTRCADCHHFDHHPIGEHDGKNMGKAPCFFKEPGSAPGVLCPCPKHRPPSNATEFADSILGPTPEDRLAAWRKTHGFPGGMTEEDGFGPRD